MITAKGKEKKIYRYQDMMTPFEKFQSLYCPKCLLKPGVTLDHLNQIVLAKSDNEAVEPMDTARDSLFQSWTARSEKRAWESKRIKTLDLRYPRLD